MGAQLSICAYRFDALLLHQVRPLGFQTQSIRDVASVSGGLPLPIWSDPNVVLPSTSWHTLSTIAPTAVMLAAIALMETLITKKMMDDKSKTSLSNARDCISLGMCYP